MGSESQIYPYDIRRVTLSIAGIPIKGGGGENDFVKFTPVGPIFTDKFGVHGDWVTSKQARFARFELTLQVGSDGAKKINALINNDHLQPNGAGIGALLCEDLENGIVINGTCRVTDEPEYPFGKDGPEVVFKGTIKDFKAEHNGAVAV